MDSLTTLRSVAVDPKTNKVYVADPINRRIQIFDSNGKFLNQMAGSRMGTHAWLRRSGHRFDKKSIIRVQCEYGRSARCLI